VGNDRPTRNEASFLAPASDCRCGGDGRSFSQWEIVKFLNAGVPWPWPKGLAVRQYRDVILPAIERGEEWHWSLRFKESPERLIGKISLHQNELDNRGYWLGLPWQGQGLMTEAVGSQ